MIALDLYCKAGGAARGLAAAGFDVIGVDIEPQPNYPYRFVRGDALQTLRDLLATGHVVEWDNHKLPVYYKFNGTPAFIWASPPCLDNTALRHAPNAKQHEDLIAPTRELLIRTGLPYVIENVDSPKARERLRDPVRICGTSFKLGFELHSDDGMCVKRYDLQRHRLFEANFPIDPAPCCHTKQRPVVGVYGSHVRCRSARHGGRKTGEDWTGGVPHAELAALALGLPAGCMTMEEYSNAIPPAYAEHVARSWLRNRAVSASA